ncbi:conjugal transfer protein TraF [Marinobacter nauticus]|uniref:conjugal transfer protein TraF n=1 Tax=Marinobacter nauticus TaxID=2743 RepID=UPI001C9A1BCC|nr:conjugal transfer protein TraF [Marinobacter nauticus]MBY5936562.1 conjugal transfer protein TraF [Marinobacter nauticus]MBY5953790.1 conjugal transfer protein TraF [Marinobacter nauticus]MBY6007583.1 conjugal transfer protein TraF [Marinobacter nauticus]
MKANRLSKLSLAIGLSVATTSALASPQAFMSARSFAMGGTGVAVAHPSAAPSANPAMMAAEQHDWADDFGLMLPSVNARAADEEEVVDQVDDIQDVIDQFNELDRNSNPEEARRLAGDLRERLNKFDRDTMRANAGLGLAFAIPTNSVSVGFMTNASLTATVRGEFDEDDNDFLATLETASVNDLVNADLDRDLESRGRILASAAAEAGISIASSFEMQSGHVFQIGVTPKYVELRTFQYTETVSDFEDDEFDADDYQTDKSGFNLDIGAAYAFGADNQWNAGVVVKNLIPMELDSAQSHPTEEKYTLELNPMVTAGIAHKSDYHVVTAELDLTKKEAFGYEDDTQWLALGAEFDAWRYAQLRAGVRHNLASNDDNDGIEEDTQFTAGLGLNIIGVRVDIGALYSSADVGAALELGTSF